MEKNIIFFRHGQTDFNIQGRWQGQTDNLLNEKGLEQAAQLGIKLSKFKLDVIYSSPLLRAVQTANTVVHHQKLPIDIVIMQNLREGNFGDAEGRTFDETRIQYHEQVDNFLNATQQNWDNHFQNGESKHQMFERVFSCFQEIVNRPGKNIGISGHGGLLSALTCGLNLKKVSFENCAVIMLTYDSESNTFSQP